jgi:flagellin-specific chaperone FliS
LDYLVWLWLIMIITTRAIIMIAMGASILVTVHQGFLMAVVIMELAIAGIIGDQIIAKKCLTLLSAGNIITALGSTTKKKKGGTTDTKMEPITNFIMRVVENVSQVEYS